MKIPVNPQRCSAASYNFIDVSDVLSAMRLSSTCGKNFLNVNTDIYERSASFYDASTAR